MVGITDSAFRQMCKRFGADVVYSEMASVTALFYAPEKTLELLSFDEIERPYVVQLFGSDPGHFEVAVKIIEDKIKPDGIDINFGCPVPKVAKQGAGAALFADLKKSREVIERTIASTELPVSVKIRAGVGDIDAPRFLDSVSDLDIAAVMIHGRTLKQGFAGPIDFGIIKKARDYFGGIILANGGINNADDAMRVLDETGADGLGLARGALGRPWIFEQIKARLSSIDHEKAGSQTITEPPPPFKAYPPDRRGEGRVRFSESEFPSPFQGEGRVRFSLNEKSKQQIFQIALDHARLAEKLKGKQGIIEMRKHLCWYAQGLPNARRLREEFVKIETIEDIEQAISAT
jgi:nifR3 family TIM-barrel protein